jgi:hypothetical protein
MPVVVGREAIVLLVGAPGKQGMTGSDALLTAKYRTLAHESPSTEPRHAFIVGTRRFTFPLLSLTCHITFGTVCLPAAARLCRGTVPRTWSSRGDSRKRGVPSVAERSAVVGMCQGECECEEHASLTSEQATRTLAICAVSLACALHPDCWERRRAGDVERGGPMSTTTKADILARIEAERERWHQLLAKIPEGRMEEPCPTGDWTFKRLAAHLTGWREWMVLRLEADPIEGATPPWPTELTDVDAINAWLDERARARPLADVLASADASYQRLASAVDGLTEEDVTTPGRFPWLEDAATLAEADLFTHLHEEHGQDLYAWVRD